MDNGSTSNLENHLTKVKDALIAEMEKSKNIVFNGLLNESIINSIPESIFVNYFLPCFIGNGNNPNWVMEWISISGSPMAPLNVFKDGTSEFLFTVPPIIHSSGLFLNKQNGDLGDIFSRYEQINNNLPSSGLNFLLEALHSKNQELLKSISLNEVTQQWLGIFNRYGMLNQEQVNTAKPKDNLSDFFEM